MYPELSVSVEVNLVNSEYRKDSKRPGLLRLIPSNLVQAISLYFTLPGLKRRGSVLKSRGFDDLIVFLAQSLWE